MGQLSAANVAVEAVMLSVRTHWPTAKILKIGVASNNDTLQDYVLETKCQKIEGWIDKTPAQKDEIK